jgi:2-phospho-L-lactate guanylyltransferase (CobY/MobA/RfbA family)
MRRADFIVSSCISVEDAARIEGSKAIVVVADDFPLRLDGGALQSILSRRRDASIVVVTRDPSGYEWLTSLFGAAGRLFILPRQTTGWSMLEHLLLSL